jgi:hypothetical protein
VSRDDEFDRRMRDAARALAPEPLPDGMLDARLEDRGATQNLRIGIAAASVVTVAVVAFTVAISTAPVATASPTPSQLPSATPNPSPSQEPPPTPAPTGSEPSPIAVPAEMIAGGSGLAPNIRSSCSNGRDGYGITVPDGWYTNRAKGVIHACQYFDDQPFRLGEVVHPITRLRVLSGRLADILVDVDKADPFQEENVTVGDGLRALRRIYGAEPTAQVGYFVALDGSGLDRDSDGRFLVATMDDPDRYATAAPALADIMDSLRVSEPWVLEMASRQAVDALFADTSTCQAADGSYTVSYPASWSAMDGPGECEGFAPAGSNSPQITISVSDGAYGFVEPPIGIEDVAVSGYPGFRSELGGVPAVEDPSDRTYEYVMYLGDGASLGPNLAASTRRRDGADYKLNVAVLDRLMSTIRIRHNDTDLLLTEVQDDGIFVAVEASADRAVAMKAACTETGPCLTSIWSSADGFRWESRGGLPGSADEGIEGIAEGRHGWVAISYRSAWRSSDGIAWQKVDGNPFGAGLDDGGPEYGAEGGCCGGELRDIAATPDGFVAVGGVTCFKCPGRSAVWLSADGRSWSRVAYQPSFEAGQMYAVVRLQTGRLVAVGAAAWVSDDGGRTWTDYALADQRAYALSLGIARGGELLAAGNQTETGIGAVWRSSDGVTWHEHQLRELNDPEVGAVGVSASEFVVAAGEYQFELGESPLAVLAGDGRSWRRLTVEPDDYGSIHGFASFRGHLIAVGQGSSGAAIWTYD